MPRSVKLSNPFLIFLLCSSATRLCGGAILILVSWHLVRASDKGYIPLALSIFLAFLPAFFVPAIIAKLSIMLNGRQITGLLLSVLACLTVLLGISQDNLVLFMFANFLTWLVFLGLEASWDMWFTQLQV